jgi:hypothetical protein
VAQPSGEAVRGQGLNPFEIVLTSIGVACAVWMMVMFLESLAK